MTYHAMVRETVKETCPSIDRMQDMIKEIRETLMCHLNSMTYQRVNNKLIDMLAHCENLRCDNTKLRAIACEALSRADTLEKAHA